MTAIDDLIREWLDGIDGDLVVPVEAAKFAAAASEQDLRAWLWERRELIVAERMGDVLRSVRARTHAQRKSRKFADAVAAGDTAALAEFASLLDDSFEIDDEDTRRPLRDMTWDNLDFAAAKYDERSAANAFEAAYLRAIQKRVPKSGSKTVGDVWTDERLRRGAEPRGPRVSAENATKDED